MDSASEHRSYAPETLRIAVVTASDSRTEANDESGAMIANMATRAGHHLVFRSIEPDKVERIRQAVMSAIDEHSADTIVLNGGTGFSGRDVSVDAVLPLLDRAIDGFGEIFRALSYQQVGAAAMLSRATAGVIGRSVVFVLPGSPKAVELAMTSLILPEAAHLVGQLRRQDFRS